MSDYPIAEGLLVAAIGAIFYHAAGIGALVAFVGYTAVFIAALIALDA